MVKVELVYDFDMPKHCGKCKMWYFGAFTLDCKCCFTQKDVSWDIRDGIKPKWCPLKEVDESEGIR